MKNKKLQKNEVKKFRNKLAYILIAFHQGVSYISQLAIQYFFKDELHIEPAQLANINSLIHIPWAIKPILGLVTDFLPIFGYRRKIYIILMGLINFMCWLSLSFWAHSVLVTTMLLLVVNLSLSFCSVLGEAVVVELSKLETHNKGSKAKDLVSLFFLAKTIGELLSSFLKGLFVDIMPLRTIFLVGSFIPSLLVLSGFILIEGGDEEEEETEDEERRCLSACEQVKYGTIKFEGEKHANTDSNIISTRNRNISHQEKIKDKSSMSTLFTFICQKNILIPLSFIIMLKSAPAFTDPFFYFITNELKLNATSQGKIYFVSTVALILAILVYKAYLKECNFKFMIALGTIVSFFVSFLCYILVLRVNLKLNISDFWMLLLSNSLMAFIGELVLLPILSLACVLCPKNLEGTVYSFFMSSLNLGGILGSINGAVLTKTMGITSKDQHNLHWLILTSKIMSLAPLPMLLCINEKYLNPEEEKHDKIKKEASISENLDSKEKVVDSK